MKNDRKEYFEFLDSIEKMIKEARLKESEKQPEKNQDQEIHEFLFECFNNKHHKITGEKEITFYNDKNEWMYQQDYKNGGLWISYDRIWSILESKSGLNYNQIKELINDWVETNLGWKGLTPLYRS